SAPTNLGFLLNLREWWPPAPRAEATGGRAAEDSRRAAEDSRRATDELCERRCARRRPSNPTPLAQGPTTRRSRDRLPSAPQGPATFSWPKGPLPKMIGE